jgi:hypothetical protein
LSISDFVQEKTQKYLVDLSNLMKGENKEDIDVLSLASNLSRYLSFGELARILVRYELFKLIKNQGGDILEFGIFMGSGIINYLTIAELLEPHNNIRRIIGFDTFSGLKGVESDFGYLKPGMYKYSNKESLQQIINVQEANKLKTSSNVILVQGDVAETFPKFIKEEPSLLPAIIYLDLDLKSSTKVVLECIEPFLRPGCIVAFDELGMRQFSGETQAFFDSKISKLGKLQKLDFAKVSYIQI